MERFTELLAILENEIGEFRDYFRLTSEEYIEELKELHPSLVSELEEFWELIKPENRDWLADWEQEAWDEAIKALEEEFKIYSTGYSNTLKENGGIYGVEYDIEGLIESNYLQTEVGGWVEMDLRDGDCYIYLLAVLKLDGEVIGDCEGFQGRYSDGKWDIYWGTY